MLSLAGVVKSSTPAQTSILIFKALAVQRDTNTPQLWPTPSGRIVFCRNVNRRQVCPVPIGAVAADNWKTIIRCSKQGQVFVYGDIYVVLMPAVLKQCRCRIAYELLWTTPVVPDCLRGSALLLGRTNSVASVLRLSPFGLAVPRYG